MASNNPDKMSCSNCMLRRRAEAKPNGWLAKLWRWHTSWCPGWKSYQKALAERDAAEHDTAQHDTAQHDTAH